MTLAPDLQATAADQCAPGSSRSGCCSLSGGPMTADDAQRIAGRLKALADPTRLRLLSHVAAQGCGAVCVCDLTEEVGISQPTVSHHMKKLVDAGLLTREQRGKWAHYSVVPEAFAELQAFLDLR
ncbi:transcriptional regulator [Kocuria dechangensis]|uniref:Transcriptional regulator n=1 Tax=Kocuria dechangensis TaxID=1176249 RepID=A0A917GYV1_9MICC|nr:metalloregulator ArsR/SmtB family transcription factor [Kocuria dechangensis]GGG60928.1 transcriptional regulator [Kocuria dechangensis]